MSRCAPNTVASHRRIRLGFSARGKQRGTIAAVRHRAKRATSIIVLAILGTRSQTSKKSLIGWRPADCLALLLALLLSTAKPQVAKRQASAPPSIGLAPGSGTSGRWEGVSNVQLARVETENPSFLVARQLDVGPETRHVSSPDHPFLFYLTLTTGLLADKSLVFPQVGRNHAERTIEPAFGL